MNCLFGVDFFSSKRPHFFLLLPTLADSRVLSMSINRTLNMARYCGCKKSSLHQKFTSDSFFDGVGLEASDFRIFFHHHMLAVGSLFGPPHELSRITFHRIFDCVYIFFAMPLFCSPFWFQLTFLRLSTCRRSHSSCIYHNTQWHFVQSAIFVHKVLVFRVFHFWCFVGWNVNECKVDNYTLVGVFGVLYPLRTRVEQCN